MVIPKVLILDGTNVAIRHFCANPAMDANGEPVGAVLGTLRMLKHLVAENKPTKVIFTWDGPGGSQRRRGTLAEYKAGRKPRLNRAVEESTGDSKQNLGWQMDKLKSLLKHLGVAQLELPNIEADDTIGYLVGLLDPTAKVIVSGDRDMWQLVSPTTAVYWPNKKVYITAETFREHCPILPCNFVLARALSGRGDSSDNIHGIKGLGEKTILKLFPKLSSEPLTVVTLMDECTLGLQEPSFAMASQKRWYEVVLANRDLVREHVALMQLTSPEISASAGAVIRNAATSKPQFNSTGFKLALLSNNLQLADQDLFSVFREYQLRVAVTA